MSHIETSGSYSVRTIFLPLYITVVYERELDYDGLRLVLADVVNEDES